MIIPINQREVKRVKFSCKCGLAFVKEIPNEVLVGAQQGNLALMQMNRDEKEVACTLIVSQVSISCPGCKKKFDLMKGEMSPREGQLAPPGHIQITLPEPRDIFYGVQDMSRGPAN